MVKRASGRKTTAQQFPPVSVRTTTVLQFPPLSRHSECQLITTKNKVRLWHSSLRLCLYNVREVVPVYKMKTYRGCEGITPQQYIELSGQFHAPCAHWTGDWVPSAASLEAVAMTEFSTADGLGLHFLCCPTCGLCTIPAELSRKYLDYSTLIIIIK